MSLPTLEVNPNKVEVNDEDLLARLSGGEEEISLAGLCGGDILPGSNAPELLPSERNGSAGLLVLSVINIFCVF